MNRIADIFKALFRGFGVLSPSCREAARLQSKALDGRLTPGQRAGLRIHLFLCKWCRRYGKQITFLREAAHKHDDEMTDPACRGLSDEARERIKKRLQSEEK